jgi:hypothetical protein
MTSEPVSGTRWFGHSAVVGPMFSRYARSGYNRVVVAAGVQRRSQLI